MQNPILLKITVLVNVPLYLIHARCIRCKPSLLTEYITDKKNHKT